MRVLCYYIVSVYVSKIIGKEVGRNEVKRVSEREKSNDFKTSKQF